MKVGGRKRVIEEGEYDHSILYTCTEISQRNTFVQLIYANKKINGERLIVYGLYLNSNPEFDWLQGK
jgi:hypothetical protein